MTVVVLQAGKRRPRGTCGSAVDRPSAWATLSTMRGPRRRDRCTPRNETWRWAGVVAASPSRGLERAPVIQNGGTEGRPTQAARPHRSLVGSPPASSWVDHTQLASRIPAPRRASPSGRVWRPTPRPHGGYSRNLNSDVAGGPTNRARRHPRPPPPPAARFHSGRPPGQLGTRRASPTWRPSLTRSLPLQEPRPPRRPGLCSGFRGGGPAPAALPLSPSHPSRPRPAPTH